MDWNKLIAELDERHEQDVYEFVVTVLAVKVVTDDKQMTFSGIGVRVSHTPDQIRLHLGHTNSATWFGKELDIDRNNTLYARIVSTSEIVLDALEMINKHSLLE